MSINRRYRKERKLIVEGRNPFEEAGEKGKNCLYLFHLLFHSSPAKKGYRNRWVPCVHRYIIYPHSRHWCDGRRIGSYDLEERKKLEEKKREWETEGKICYNRSCREGDVHFKSTKKSRYRLRPTIASILFEKEKEWKVLENSMTYFSQEKSSVFGDQFDVIKRKNLLFSFLLNWFLTKTINLPFNTAPKIIIAFFGDEFVLS